jgi:cation:H+ antiporter
MKQWFVTTLTGHGVLLPLAVFLLAGMLVFLVASRLAQHADAIADSTGLGRLWIGSLLLAGSTSMPEIITDINAALFGVPDIGVGDLFGSTLANMLILALLVIAYERRQLLQQAALDHALVGVLAIVLTALAGFSIASGGLGTLFGIGLDTLSILLIYVIGMRVVFDLTRRAANAPRAATPEDAVSPRLLVRRALLGFGSATLGLLLLAPALIFSADALALEAGLSNTFVGTFLVGLTTSFPELGAAIAAVRLGAVDLAVGNIFGSNAFNMTVLLLMDFAYRGEPLLTEVSRSHVISAGAAVIALAFGVMAILARTHQRAWVARFIAALIIVIYGLSIFVLAHRF